MAEGQKRGGFKKFSKSYRDGEGGCWVLTWAAWVGRGCVSVSMVTSRKQEVFSLLGNLLKALGASIPTAAASSGADGSDAGIELGAVCLHRVPACKRREPLLSSPKSQLSESIYSTAWLGLQAGAGVVQEPSVCPSCSTGMEWMVGGKSTVMEPHSGPKQWELSTEEVLVPTRRELRSFSQTLGFPQSPRRRLQRAARRQPCTEQDPAFTAAPRIPLPPCADAGAGRRPTPVLPRELCEELSKTHLPRPQPSWDFPLWWNAGKMGKAPSFPTLQQSQMQRMLGH